MSIRTRWLALSLIVLAVACACFVGSHYAGPLVASLALFIAGTLLVLGFFIALFYFLEEKLTNKAHGLFFVSGMLVVSTTFSLLYFFSADIVGHDIEAYELLDVGLAALVAFVLVALCSVVFFRRLRVHADSLYTAGFTAVCAMSSALLYLSSDVLPDDNVVDAIRLVIVISSLSLALSLFLIEWDKRKKATTLKASKK